jgi:hypothetical protein
MFELATRAAALPHDGKASTEPGLQLMVRTSAELSRLLAGLSDAPGLAMAERHRAALSAMVNMSRAPDARLFVEEVLSGAAQLSEQTEAIAWVRNMLAGHFARSLSDVDVLDALKVFHQPRWNKPGRKPHIGGFSTATDRAAAVREMLRKLGVIVAKVRPPSVGKKNPGNGDGLEGQIRAGKRRKNQRVSQQRRTIRQ